MWHIVWIRWRAGPLQCMCVWLIHELCGARHGRIIAVSIDVNNSMHKNNRKNYICDSLVYPFAFVSDAGHLLVAILRSILSLLRVQFTSVFMLSRMPPDPSVCVRSSRAPFEYVINLVSAQRTDMYHGDHDLKPNSISCLYNVHRTHSSGECGFGEGNGNGDGSSLESRTWFFVLFTCFYSSLPYILWRSVLFLLRNEFPLFIGFGGLLGIISSSRYFVAQSPPHRHTHTQYGQQDL